MSGIKQRAVLLSARVDGWLTELGLTPVERAEREGATSWDLVLDGRHRRSLRVTLILDPALALIAWVQFGPPMTDNFRKSYRQLLRWNDELPFAKFAISEDERPILTLEESVEGLERDRLGALLARVLAIADLVHEPALAVMSELRRKHAELTTGEPDAAGVRLLERILQFARRAGRSPYGSLKLSITQSPVAKPHETWMRSPCFRFAGLKTGFERMPKSIAK